MPAKLELYKVTVDSTHLEALNTNSGQVSFIKLGSLKAGVTIDNVVLRKIEETSLIYNRWHIVRWNYPDSARRKQYMYLGQEGDNPSKTSVLRRFTNGDVIDIENDSNGDTEAICLQRQQVQGSGTVTTGKLEIMLMVSNPDDLTPGFTVNVTVPAETSDIKN